MKKTLLFILILITSPVMAVKILYPGVKVNNKPLAQVGYLLTEEEFKATIKDRETVKIQKEVIAEKEIQIKAYDNAVTIMNNNLSKTLEQSYKAAERLMKAADDKDALLKENRKLNRKVKNNNLLSLFMLGISLGKSGGFGIKF